MQTTHVEVRSMPQDNQQCCCCLDYRKGVILTGSLFLVFCAIIIIWEAVTVATTVQVISYTTYTYGTWIYYADFGIFGIWILGSIFLIIGGAQRTSGFVLAGYIISIICVIIYGISTGYVAYYVFYTAALGFAQFVIVALIVSIVKIVLFFLMCYGLHGISRYRTQLAIEATASRQTVVSSTYTTNPGTAYINYGHQQPAYAYNQPVYNQQQPAYAYKQPVYNKE